YNLLNKVWKYDSQADSWTQLDTFPGKPRVKPIAVTINGKAYVGMGCNGSAYDNSVFKDFYEFDPSTGKWTPKAPFPGPAANDLAFSVVNGCLYTAMGFSGTGTNNDTYKYDPVANTWTQLED
ncbi:MAG: galactose oxidase, partial [Bacteroidia bacterium]|nr:galactose oxidase [Bacteroidia bacterium]